MGFVILNIIYELNEVFEIEHEVFNVFYVPDGPFKFAEAVEKEFIQKLSELGGI